MTPIHTVEPAGGAGDLTIVRTGHPNDHFATVRMLNSGQVAVTGWLEQNNQLVEQPGEDITAGTVSEVEAVAGENPGDLFVVFRTSTGKSKPTFYTITASGDVDRLGSASSAHQYAGTNLRVASAQVDGQRMFTLSQKTSSGNLYRSTWTYDTSSDVMTRIWSNLGLPTLSIAGLGAQAVGNLGEGYALPVRRPLSGVNFGDLMVFRVRADGSQDLVIDERIGPAGELSFGSVTEYFPHHRHLVGVARRDENEHMQLTQYEVSPGPHEDVP